MKKGLRRMYLAFLSPVVIAFLIAYLYPVLRTVQMSFFEVSDISAARDTWEFVGLYNYVDLFSRQLFRVSFKNMMLIFLAGGAAVFLISLFFAWVLHKGMFMGNLWRNLIYLPTVITPVAMITVWTQYAYNSRYGLLKTVFETLGLDGLAAIPWTSTQYAFWSMLIAFCFCSIGGNLLVYMAAMKKIPDDLFEAAFMDGATEERFFSASPCRSSRTMLKRSSPSGPSAASASFCGPACSAWSRRTPRPSRPPAICTTRSSVRPSARMRWRRARTWAWARPSAWCCA